MDFHLVFGTNEAGKSTTLSAATDLLFGFPHNRAYDFRFAASLLRVGGVLEEGETRLSFSRGRARDTFRDETGEPVDEARLLALLHGRTADEFRAKFSLDHARLRDGGRTIVDAKGDLGQTLFAAGSGVLNAQNLLKVLQAEADAIYSSRHRATYKLALQDLKDAEARVKAAAVKPKDWKAAREALDDLTKRQQDLIAERLALHAELHTVARRRALAVPVQQRAAALASIAGESAPAFTPSHDEAHAEIISGIAAADVKRVAAVNAIADARAARDRIDIDPNTLQAEARIVALVREDGEVSKALYDRGGIEEELVELTADIDRLTHALQLRPAPAASLLESLPPPAILADLQSRAAKRQAIETRLDQSREQLRGHREAMQKAERALALQSGGSLSAQAEDALREGRSCAAVAGRLAERRRATAAAASAAETAQHRLAPWQGDEAALARIVPPPEEDIRNAEAAMADAARSLQNSVLAVQARRNDLARLVLETEEVKSSRRAVSAAELADSRSARDAAWEAIRASLLSRTPLPDPEAAIEAYETARAASDALADERFETATASARLGELGINAAIARLDVSQLTEAQVQRQAELDEARRHWAERLAGCGLPEMTPAEASRWARDQSEALDKARLHREAEAAERDDETAVAKARAALLAVLGAGAAPLANASFGNVLEHVQRLVDADAAALRLRTGLQATLRAETEAVATAEQRIAELEDELAAWADAWRGASTSAGVSLSPDSVATLLPLFEQLRSALVASGKAQDRLAGIARDQQRFEARALDLAAACGITEPTLDPHAITEKLRLSLLRAQTDARAAGEQDSILERREAERREAERVIAAGEQALAPLMEIAGCTDRAGLADALLAARRIRSAQADIKALEASILAAGEGHTLEALLAEAASTDAGWLAQEAARLNAKIAGLDSRIAEAAEIAGAKRSDLEKMDGPPDAATAASDAEQARATVAAEAEAYIMKRAQFLTLKWAVDNYHKRQESPLLNRASALFRRLTLDRYSQLEIDRETEKPRLVARSADERSVVAVDGMSDGTADQLFLALRLAALEQSLDAGIVLPFLADDLFINFDDQRAFAGFQVLGDLARRTQVLFFTHHEHLSAIAEAALHPHALAACRL
jgi:uncharacterized protein YhaN